MFHLIVAFALYLVMSPIRPALSLADLSPTDLAASGGGQPMSARHLSVAEAKGAEDLPTAASDQPEGPVRKDDSRLGIETEAEAVAVMDWESGRMLFEKNARVALPIASITKLVTALTVLDLKTDWTAEVTFLASDDRIGDLPVLMAGDRVTVKDLFMLSLVMSSNDATAALARSTGLEPDDFVRQMNRVAKGIGMENNYFVEPTGLNSNNSASAADVARLTKVALSRQEISQAVLSEQYEFDTLDGKHSRVRNTDQLLDSFLSQPPYSFLGGKTGFLNEAGYCFAAAASNGQGDRVVAVVLGAATKQDRFLEVKRLIWWAFDAWEWPDRETSS